MKLHTFKTKFEQYHRDETTDTNISLYHNHTMLVKIRSKKKINTTFNDVFTVSSDDVMLPYIKKSKFDYIVVPTQGLGSLSQYIYDKLIDSEPTKIIIIRCPLRSTKGTEVDAFIKPLTKLIYVKTDTTEETISNVMLPKYDCLVMNINADKITRQWKKIYK